jgi:hypothetical protein
MVMKEWAFGKEMQIVTEVDRLYVVPEHVMGFNRRDSEHHEPDDRKGESLLTFRSVRHELHLDTMASASGESYYGPWW